MGGMNRLPPPPSFKAFKPPRAAISTSAAVTREAEGNNERNTTVKTTTSQQLLKQNVQQQQQQQPRSLSLPVVGGSVREDGAGVKVQRVGQDVPSASVAFWKVLMTRRTSKKLRKNKSWQDGVLRVDFGGKKLELLDEEAKRVVTSRLTPALQETLAALEDATTPPSSFTFDVSTFEVELDQRISSREYTSGSVFLSSSSCAAPGGRGGVLASHQHPSMVAFHAKKVRKTDSTAEDSGTVPKLVTRKPILDSTGKMHIENCVLRYLRPHQVDGVEFMYRCVSGRRAQGFTGCILADSMGLGKTLQVLALMWTMLAAGEVSKAVVAAPSSLVAMWRDEVQKWLGKERLIAHVVQAGPKANDVVDSFCSSRLQKLLVISYDMVRKLGPTLGSAGIDLLVLDEAHRLKENNKTMVALEAMRSSRRILVTGTPIQNNLMEFHALMSFATGSHALLGTPSAFRKVFMLPISEAKDRDASEQTVALGMDRASELARLSSSYMLRRENSVLQSYLPRKREFTVFCRMSTVQRRLYGAVVDSVLRIVRMGGFVQTTTLGALQMLAQIASHPLLCLSTKDGDLDRLARSERRDDKENHGGRTNEGNEFTPYAAGGGCVEDDNIRDKLRRMYDSLLEAGTAHAEYDDDGSARGAGDEEVDDDEEITAAQERKTTMTMASTGNAITRNSGKFSVLHSLLSTIMARNEKVVVASGSTVTLDLVGKLCATCGWQTVRLDGSMNAEKRETAVSRFRNSDRSLIFLLSKRAGGVGLTLVSGNHLICMDVDWNPAIDAQTHARIFREGQTRETFIYKLCSSYSIDEKMLQRQISKDDVASNFLLESSLLCRGDDEKNNAESGGCGSSAFTDSGAHFSREQILELFSMKPRADGCDTHRAIASASTHSKRWVDQRAAVCAEGDAPTAMQYALHTNEHIISFLQES